MKKQPKLQIIADVALLPIRAQEFIKKNGFKGKNVLAMVLGNKLVSAISYTHVSSNECFIHYMGNFKRSALIRGLRGSPEEYLLELLVCKGARVFNHKELRKAHAIMVEKLNKQGMLEYNEEWKFKVTDEAVRRIREKTHEIGFRTESMPKLIRKIVNASKRLRRWTARRIGKARKKKFLGSRKKIR